MHSKLETLHLISAGKLTIDDAAAQHGVTRETVIEWSEFFLAGTQRRRSPRALLAAFALFGAMGLAGAARAACNAPSYGNLIGVCPDAPAIAAEYNSNLQRVDTRLASGVTATAQVQTNLTNAINGTAAKIGALGTAGVVLQAPATFGGNVCGGGEVLTTDSSNAVDCRPLYSNTGSPIITAWETGDVGSGSTTGNYEQDLASTANTVCFLSDVRFQDVDDANEEVRCLVERVGNIWRLYARANGDSNAVCRARCIQFNF